MVLIIESALSLLSFGSVSRNRKGYQCKTLSLLYASHLRLGMKASWSTGLSFGLTSGVITTLGLIVGLHSGTHSRTIVMGGVLMIAISDALSDALGIHISEEGRSSGSARHVWEATLATFVSKFIVAMTFLVPIVLCSLGEAIVISVIWGFCLVTALSVFVAKTQAISPWQVIVEHVVIAGVVVMVSFAVGHWVNKTFLSD